jgi:hypothetical protein
MKRPSGLAGSLLVSTLFSLALFGCAQMSGDGGGWTTLIDGDKGLDNFTRVGDANWRAENGAIVADKGKGGFLVSKKAYKDFQMRAEFWAESHTNSGIFVRMTDPVNIGSKTSYEVNIFDTRPGPEYGTGAIVNVAKVEPIYKAGGRWSTMEITARGPQLVVVFNGVQTVNVQNSQFPQGPFSLQFGNVPPKDLPGGPIKFRKVQIREL